MLGGNGAVWRATQAIANDAVAQAQLGRCQSYLLTSPKLGQFIRDYSSTCATLIEVTASAQKPSVVLRQK